MVESLHRRVDDEHERDACRKRPADLEWIMSPSHLGQQFHRYHREDDAGGEMLDAASDNATRRVYSGDRRAKECGDNGNRRDQAT